MVGLVGDLLIKLIRQLFKKARTPAVTGAVVVGANSWSGQD
jgi:hypothetical protein